MVLSMQEDDKTIEASWAPSDPRDTSVDKSANTSSKVGGITRIVGAMHPVLNLFILVYDALVHRSKLAWGILLGLLVSLLVIYASYSQFYGQG